MPCVSRPYANRRRRGFSLVELVLVVTIISILAAIAVPRMSGAAVSAKANALQATLTNVRKAVDVYYAEHGKYPGYTPGTNTPNDTAFLRQLMFYSDDRGATNSTYSAQYEYGPYLRTPFPTNPTNGLNSVKVKADPSEADPADGSVGWIAVFSHGYFGISASDTDLGDIGVDIDDIPLIKGKVRL